MPLRRDLRAVLPVPPSARTVLAGRLALVCLLAACGGGDLVLPENRGATSIEIVGGDGQRGAVGQPLADPIVVEVTDGGGDPIEGATVEFALTSAGEGAGTTPPSARTNPEGRAQAFVLLGDKLGVQSGEARVVGDGPTSPKATFTALATSPDNRVPRADFDWSCEGLTCGFTDASEDSDGSVTGWSWTFGDGGTSSEREPEHSYAAGGTYTVTLTVTDDGGSTDESSDEVTASASSAPPANRAPRADFAVSCQDLDCAFTDQSQDEDGTIESRHWDFGDGTTSTERNPSHSYGSAGQYDVTLTVTDDDGAEDGRVRSVEADAPAPPPPPPANDPPRAEFEVSCQDLRCTFVDRSTDADGSVAAWRYEFGDGASSAERNPSHTYAAPGRYEVLLVVTDDDGAADTQTRTAEPAAPPPPPGNQPPEADFDVRCRQLTCSFEDKSKDEDGTIVTWSWNFGDGSTSSERDPVHTYATPDRFDVVLTVTDDRGATDTKERRADPKD